MAIISPLTSTGKATGGAIEESDIDGTTYTLHTFLSTGVFQVGADNITGVDVLVVGGGGGGGGHEGGGGGGGGVIHIENRTLTAGVAYYCRVGI
ncbi:MAG: hypothetical protein QF535_01780, partial [Anaerolineales bacterium]|nr:hypothetical protein [Anaerolineales bacterium]